MSKLLSALALLSLLEALSSPVSAQTTHVVRMISEPAKESYRFEPAEVRARPNDVLVFRVGSGAPHSVTYEADGLTPAVHAALNAAMPGRAADLASPMLTATGKEYRMSVPAIPAGRYPFFCLPHRAYDMRGVLVVE